jgi:hypothetical protein
MLDVRERIRHTEVLLNTPDFALAVFTISEAAVLILATLAVAWGAVKLARYMKG